MNTKGLILDVALILFNERGEVLVTSVDLAHEMNISPGNLYYHYKGKKEVIEALYARFHVEFSNILAELDKLDEPVFKTVMAYLCLISELFTRYSFISQDATNISIRYPSIQVQLSRQLRRLYVILINHAKRLPPNVILDYHPDSPQIMAENVLNTLLNLNTNYKLIAPSGEGGKFKKIGIEDHLYLQILPFLKD